MRLGRAVAAALAPVKAERFKNFGADTDSQFLWRFDAAAAAALPPSAAAALSAPRSLAVALAARDALGPHEPRVRELQALVADAEVSGAARAAWLAPYRITLDGVTVELRDCAARDPAQRVTVVATTLSVVQA